MKKSLPELLSKSLQGHAAASDIEHDDELEEILEKLSDLSRKVEKLKAKSRANKQTAQVICINSARQS